jgi:diaminopimelate epimerase
MCGNGIRCVALHLARAAGARSLDVIVETDAGPRACALMARGDAEADVVVDMGAVRATGTVSVEVEGRRFDLDTADAGNPHAILFGEASPDIAQRLGPAIATHPVFSQGTNVEFAHVGPDGIDVVVWERGVGLTLACGTGACAVAVVAQKKRLVPSGTTRVRLPGGPLDIEVGDITRMRGPARLVFEGILA